MRRQLINRLEAWRKIIEKETGFRRLIGQEHNWKNISELSPSSLIGTRLQQAPAQQSLVHTAAGARLGFAPQLCGSRSQPYSIVGRLWCLQQVTQAPWSCVNFTSVCIKRVFCIGDAASESMDSRPLAML